jgi:RNA polymerase sigma-70 factor (ECF subfamily)
LARIYGIPLPAPAAVSFPPTELLARRRGREHYHWRVPAPKPVAPSSPASDATSASASPADGAALDDVELVARMVRGDRTAVALLYQRHQAPLFGLARSLLRSATEAEDLLHDVFLEAWRRSADYSAERGSVRAWLILRTRSRALDRLKSAARPRGKALEPAADTAPVDTGDQQRVRELLTQMPEAQQQVMLLGYFEGLSSAEISERLGIPIGTVKSRTRAALETLRDVLGKGHV